jgi:hypothetical protein
MALTDGGGDANGICRIEDLAEFAVRRGFVFGQTSDLTGVRRRRGLRFESCQFWLSW